MDTTCADAVGADTAGVVCGVGGINVDVCVGFDGFGADAAAVLSLYISFVADSTVIVDVCTIEILLIEGDGDVVALDSTAVELVLFVYVVSADAVESGVSWNIGIVGGVLVGDDAVSAEAESLDSVVIFVGCSDGDGGNCVNVVDVGIGSVGVDTVGDDFVGVFSVGNADAGDGNVD
jgi:hypothetical protein